MSRYIDLDLYHAVERSHPYYEEMLAEICRRLREACEDEPSAGYRLLEFGAGTGLATQDLLDCGEIRIDAVDLDQECCGLMKEHLDGVPGLKIIRGNILDHRTVEPYDAIVSVFAHDHIRYAQGPELARNLRRNLEVGGRYFMGGEILPRFHDDDSRREALYLYHGFIVDKALRDGHFELAQIEISALRSGLHEIGDFKRHEEMFETEMLSADFRLSSRMRVGPLDRDDVGGVYIYEFEAI